MSDWMGKELASAGRGAAAGAVLGPIGAGVGAALSVAMDLLPGSSHLLASSEDTIKKVTDVVGNVDPMTLTDDAKADLQVQLAQIAQNVQDQRDQAKLDQMKAAIADTSSARQQTIDLSKEHSIIAFGAPIISVVVLMMFAGAVYLLANNDIPDRMQPLMNTVVGTLGAMAMAVVSYWVGSNSDSRRQTGIIANSVPASMLPSPSKIEPAKGS